MSKKPILFVAFLFCACTVLTAQDGPAKEAVKYRRSNLKEEPKGVTEAVIGPPKISLIAGSSTLVKVEVEVAYELTGLEKSFVSVVTTAERIGNDGGVDQNLVFSTEMGGPPKPGEGPVKIKYDYIVPMGKDTKFTARMNYKNAADELKHKSDDRTFRAEMPTR